MENKMSGYNIVGVMSGTSLDGLDIAHCTFQQAGEKWKFTINQAETIPYPEEWINRLQKLHNTSAHEFVVTDALYGKYIGEKVTGFLESHHLDADLVASHGHTIFHQPGQGYTTQIGHGGQIASVVGIPVICDFRTLDVALGGQGAPLVPLGDRLLFSDYRYCLNIGGFANISFDDIHGRRRAFDICPANFLLNKAARLLSHSFDRDGKIAESGKMVPELYESLNKLSYYSLDHPKSLGREFVEKEIEPLLEKFTMLPEDLLKTFTEHIAYQVARTLSKAEVNEKILITGGGARNKYLVKRISQLITAPLTIPDSIIIDYKEALIFAFLGLLRWQGMINTLASVTGARRNSSGGAVFLG